MITSTCTKSPAHFVVLSVLIVVGTFFSFTGHVSAEEMNDNSFIGSSTVVDAPVVVADINIADVTVSESGDTLSGSFTIKSGMGQQNNVHYGVGMYRKDDRSLITAKKIGTVTELQEGQVETVAFTYQLPTSLQGDVSILLIGESEGGLNFGSHVLLEKTFSGTPSDATCTVDALILTCSSSKEQHVTIRTSRTLFGTPYAHSITGSLAKGKDSTFTLTGEPGPLSVYVETDSFSHVYQTSVPGMYGFIRSVTVSDATPTDGEIDVIATVRLSQEVIDPKLAYALKDTTGAICGSGEIAVTKSSLFSTSIATPCHTGSITVTLTSGDGAVLNTKTEKFSTELYVPKERVGTEPEAQSPQPSASLENTFPYTLKIALALCILAVVGIGLTVALRRNKVKKSGMTLVVLASAILVGYGGNTPTAEAVQMSLSTPSQVGGYGTGGEITVGPTSNNPYAPNSPITFSASGDISCEESCGQYITLLLAKRSNSGGTLIFDDSGVLPAVGVEILLQNVQIPNPSTTIFSPTVSFSGTTPSSVGPHSLWVLGSLFQKFSPLFASVNDKSDSLKVPIPFTVASPPPTTVDVYFP